MSIKTEFGRGHRPRAKRKAGRITRIHTSNSRTLVLFIVADGVGGAQAGEVASQMAVEIIGEAFIIWAKRRPRRDDADRDRTGERRDLSNVAGPSAACLNGDDAGRPSYFGRHRDRRHVGDSRVYRVDADGTLFRETDDHSVVEEEVRAGRMTPEQALVHPSRNVISRALGAEESVDPDIKNAYRASGDDIFALLGWNHPAHR